MIAPLQSFEIIARLLESGMAMEDPRDMQAAMAGAHTHAILQASSLRKQEAYGERIAAMFRGEALH